MALDQAKLEELRVKLQKEKERLERELSAIARKKEDGKFEVKFPDDIGDRNDENATEVEEFADMLAVEKALEAQLKDVNDALAKMENGTYGICEKTGREIPLERLEAYPAARTVVDA